MSHAEFIERSVKAPWHEAPRVRLSRIVGEAVQKALSNQVTTPEFVATAILEAQKQADFLIILTIDLAVEVELECRLNTTYCQLFYALLYRVHVKVTQPDRLGAVIWDAWRAKLIERLCVMWQLRQKTMAISERYFDRHPILFRDQASELDEQIHDLEQLTKFYNSFKGKLPIWTAIDVEALAHSVREQLPEEIAYCVASAKSTVLKDWGEPEAVWKIMQPYWLAQFEKPRATTASRTKGTS